MTRHFTALLAVAIATAATAMPIASHAATTSSPVRVASCEPRSHPFDQQAGYTVAMPPPGGENSGSDVYGHPFQRPPNVTRETPVLAISYTNQTQKPIKQIDFALVSNGTLVEEVRDVGTFAPGVQIKHEFGLKSLPSGTSKCIPLQASFADGTTWKNPKLPKM